MKVSSVHLYLYYYVKQAHSIILLSQAIFLETKYSFLSAATPFIIIFVKRKAAVYQDAMNKI